MGKLDIRPSDDLDGLHDVIRVFLELLLQFPVYGQHRCGTERVPRVDPHGVHVFDETHGDHLILGVPHHLKLELFPAEDGLFDEYLPY